MKWFIQNFIIRYFNNFYQLMFSSSKKKLMIQNYSSTPCKMIECPICLNLKPLPEMMKTLCGHDFCNCCIQQWKKMNNTCPSCRKKLSMKEKKMPSQFYINDYFPNILTNDIDNLVRYDSSEVRVQINHTNSGYHIQYQFSF